MQTDVRPLVVVLVVVAPAGAVVVADELNRQVGGNCDRGSRGWITEEPTDLNRTDRVGQSEAGEVPRQPAQVLAAFARKDLERDVRPATGGAPIDLDDVADAGTPAVLAGTPSVGITSSLSACEAVLVLEKARLVTGPIT